MPPRRPATPPPSPRPRRPPVWLLHPGDRGPGQGHDRQERVGPDPGEGGPAARRPPVPLHRLREDPRRGRGPGPGRDPGRHRAGASAPAASSTRAATSGSATGPSSTTWSPDEALAGAAPRRGPPERTTPGPTSPPSTPRRPRPCPAWSGSSPQPTCPASCRVGLIHKDWPIFIPVGGPHQLPGRRARDGGGRGPADGPRRRRARRGDLRRAGAAGRPGAGRRRPRCPRRGVGARRQRAVDLDLLAGRRRGGARRRSAHVVDRDLPDPAHRPRLPRTRVDPGRAGPGRAAGTVHLRSGRTGGPGVADSTCTRGGQGIWDDRNDIAAMLGVDTVAGHDRAGLERWRVRRQGGHVEPGPDRAGGVADSVGRSRPPSRARSRSWSTPSGTRSACTTGPVCDADGKLVGLGPRWSATRAPTPRSA